MIPYGKQNINQADIDAVVATLQSDFLTQGDKVPAFEKTIARACQAEYGCATSSATSALHLACLALGVAKDDIVWTSPITFVASANAALYCQATIDFVDIDRDSGLLSVTALAAKLQQAQQDNRLPKVLIVVHLGGQSCDMAAIQRLCQPLGIRIIEDASHAIGARYQGRPVGCCQYSAITVFSFHPVKIITTAEGGMALTQQKALAEKMARLRSHGITRDDKLFTEPSHGDWFYQQIELGYNYRMTDIQAALGISQSRRLAGFVSQRNALAARYDEKLANLPLSPLKQMGHLSAYHLYIVLTDNSRLNRDQLFNHLRQCGVNVNLHYIPVHLQPYYQKMGFKAGDFPAAESYYQSAITLPLYPDLSHEQQDHVINCIAELC